jgi:3-oxoacyl-[acyl-carrier protein] reductase
MTDRKRTNEKRQRRALVTGASRGIGRAAAAALAEAGCSLFLTARNSEALEETAALCKERFAERHSAAETVRSAGRLGTGLRIECFSCDLAGPDSAERIASAFRGAFQGLDILVNNAGIAPSGPIGGYRQDDWDRVMNINCRAPFFLMQEFIPLLAEAQPGFIINIGSVVSKKGYKDQALYAASKHALLGMTKSAARDLAEKNIRVHAVLPGGVDTDLVRSVRPDIDTSELIAAEDIAKTILFLISMKGNAVIDEVSLRRSSKEAWG